MESRSEFATKTSELIDLQEEMAKKFAGIMMMSVGRIPKALGMSILKTFNQYQDVVGEMLTLFLDEIEAVNKSRLKE